MVEAPLSVFWQSHYCVCERKVSLKEAQLKAPLERLSSAENNDYYGSKVPERGGGGGVGR